MNYFRIKISALFKSKFLFYFTLVIFLASAVEAQDNWTGTTNQGRPMSFRVSPNGTQWDYFSLSYGWSSGSYSGTMTFTNQGPGNIISNQFSVSGSFAFTGQFTSATTATGTYTITSYPVTVGIPYPPYVQTIYISGSGTWNATKMMWSALNRLTYTAGDAKFPAITKDSSKNIHIVWQDNTSGNFEIYYKNSTDDGSTFSPPKRLTYNSGDSCFPVIASDSSDNIYVAWQDISPGQNEIFLKKSTDGGTSWGTPNRFTYNSGQSKMPSIGVDPWDGIYVAWQDSFPGNPEIFYKKSTDSGATWGTLNRMTWNAGDSANPSWANSYSGLVQVVWQDNSLGNFEIFCKFSTDAGSSWAPLERLTWNSGDSTYPKIHEDKNYNTHVVWQDNSPGNYEIFYKKYDMGVGSWTGLSRITWNPVWSSNPSIFCDTYGDVHIVWENGFPEEIYYKKTWNNTWGATNRFTWNSGNSGNSMMLINSGKHVHIVWQDNTTGDFEIFYKNYK